MARAWATARATVLGCLLLAATAAAQTDDRSAVLAPPGPHAVWVADLVLRHSVLFDGDSGQVLGMVDGGATLTPKVPMLARSRNELYSVDTTYSRGRRGDRSDHVSIYDASSLDFVAEIELPTKAADTGSGIALAAMLDGERFLVVFNQFPRTSISVIDLEARRFVTEIVVAGCGGVYAVSELRMATLCGNGTVLMIELDDSGRQTRLVASEPFFDPEDDPVTVAGVRDGARWHFVSFEGNAYAVDFSGAAPAVAPGWSLLDDADRAARWRVGGAQHLALHRTSQTLYSVMHQGGLGSHKAAGPEIWVYDLARHQRTARFEVPNLAAAFLAPNLGVEPGTFLDWLLRLVIPNQGAHSVAVTQDDAPLLFTRHGELGAVAVLDARSGEHRRDLFEVGLAGSRLEVP